MRKYKFFGKNYFDQGEAGESWNNMFYVWQHDTGSIGDKQVLCLRPTVPGVASLSSVIVSNILGIIFFGGAAQTGGVGKRAAVVPEPTCPVLGAVPGPAPILVLVPGQEQVVIMLLFIWLQLTWCWTSSYHWEPLSLQGLNAQRWTLPLLKHIRPLHQSVWR